jgi:hypothetical protein
LIPREKNTSQWVKPGNSHGPGCGCGSCC